MTKRLSVYLFRHRPYYTELIDCPDRETRRLNGRDPFAKHVFALTYSENELQLFSRYYLRHSPIKEPITPSSTSVKTLPLWQAVLLFQCDLDMLPSQSSQSSCKYLALYEHQI